MIYLDKEKHYDVGQPENYGSIYGYQKKRYPVFEVDAEGNRVGHLLIGHIKEEIGLDEQGQPNALTYYSKNLGRQHGQYRFYPTTRALIVAMGGKVVRLAPISLPVPIKKPRKKVAIATARRAPAAKKAKPKKKMAKRVKKTNA